MADNFTISTAGGEETVGADEISSVKYQRIKQIFGPNGTQTGEVGLASTTVVQPLPANVYLASDYLMVAGLGIAPKFAYVAFTADANIVAAVTDKKIRVLAFHIDETDQTADVTLNVEDGSGGSTLAHFAGMDLEAKCLPFSPVGWFETSSGEALYGDVEGTTPALKIHVVYIEV